jgi:hypothetical protein
MAVGNAARTRTVCGRQDRTPEKYRGELRDGYDGCDGLVAVCKLYLVACDGCDGCDGLFDYERQEMG